MTDATGATVYTSGAIDDQHNVDPEAYFYRSLPTDREGQLVWRHDLFNQTGEASRNVVGPSESDLNEYEFSVPYWAAGPLSISAVLRYRKLNTRYARWALKDDYQKLPVVDMARDFLQLPVRERIEAYQANPIDDI